MATSALSARREGGLPRAILDETAHARALILGREQPRELQPLDLRAGAEAGFQAVVDRIIAFHADELTHGPSTCRGHDLMWPLAGARPALGQERVDLRFAVAAMPAERPDRTELALLRPPGDRLGVDPQQRGHLGGGQEAFGLHV